MPKKLLGGRKLDCSPS